VIALRQTSARIAGTDKVLAKQLAERVQIGETQILSVRGEDGGWNYGNPKAIGIELPSYPETTALALVGLQSRSDLDSAFHFAQTTIGQTPSPLARAWLSIALRLHGAQAPEITSEPSKDIMITAIEALSAAEGNWKLLKAGEAA